MIELRLNTVQWSLRDDLHQVCSERDCGGNRTLRMDQTCMLILRFLVNSTVRSLHEIQQASELKKIQKKFGWARLAGLSI